jgi:protein transport protein SEC23
MFVFCIDTCVSAVDELRELGDSIQQSLNLLPSNDRIALITFGTNVSVYELASSAIPKAYILRGNKEYTTSAVCQLLGCHAGSAAAAPGAPPGNPVADQLCHRFVLPVSECNLTAAAIFR